MVDRVETIEATAARMLRGRVSRRSKAGAETNPSQPNAAEVQPGDKPVPNDQVSEEERARIAAAMSAVPSH
jgi:hypothetical protein